MLPERLQQLGCVKPQHEHLQNSLYLLDSSLAEGVREGEGDQDEDASQQGEGGAGPLDGDDARGIALR